MRASITHRLWILIFSISLILSACSLQSPTVITQPGNPPLTGQATPNSTQTVAAVQLMSTKEYLSEDPEVLGYHAVLMVERAADLILQYGEKVQANEIDKSDSSIRKSYTDAFPVAVDTFNKTTPPKWMSHSWSNVFKVLQVYNQAYTALIQGKPLAYSDIVNLKMSSQLVTNYQTMAEANLKQRDLGIDFLQMKQAEVEQHFQEAYGDDPLPTLEP